MSILYVCDFCKDQTQKVIGDWCNVNYDHEFDNKKRSSFSSILLCKKCHNSLVDFIEQKVKDANDIGKHIRD